MVRITHQLAASTTRPSQADHELSQALVLADFHPRILPHFPGGGLWHALSSGTHCSRQRLHTGSPTKKSRGFPTLRFFWASEIGALNLFHSCQSFFVCVCVFLMGNIAASDRLRMFSSIGQSQGFPDALWFAGHYLRLPFGQCVEAWLLRKGWYVPSGSI